MKDYKSAQRKPKPEPPSASFFRLKREAAPERFIHPDVTGMVETTRPRFEAFVASATDYGLVAVGSSGFKAYFWEDHPAAAYMVWVDNGTTKYYVDRL